MLNTSVSPLASMKSSMPYRTPFSVENATISSIGRRPLRATDTIFRAHARSEPEILRLRPGLASGPLQLAGGRKDRVLRLDGADELPAPAGAFLVELRAGVELAETTDIHGLEELVVVLAHEAVAAAEDPGLHTFELLGDRLGVVRLRFVRRLREHPHFVDRARIEQPDAFLGAERGLPFLRLRRGGVGYAFRDR